MPSIVVGSGPFADRKANWIGNPSPAERQIATSFYLGLMTATCLELIKSEGDIIVEGPFSTNENFLDMLSAATGRSVALTNTATTGITIGASLLLTSEKTLKANEVRRQLSDLLQLQSYA